VQNLFLTVRRKFVNTDTSRYNQIKASAFFAIIKNNVSSIVMFVDCNFFDFCDMVFRKSSEKLAFAENIPCFFIIYALW